METERGLVKVTETRLPKFVQDAYDSIEGMKAFAAMLLDSKLVPDFYYEKGPDNKPDYTKGKVPAVVVVLLQAQQLAIPPMTALQHVIPVNGLLSIKGDLAKTMIFASGKLKKDSWVETVTGSIEDQNMVVTITATREDNGITLTRSFSVDKAKRMGLWITESQVSGADGWKYKKSAWYKTPDRMIMYRCLGNLARDLFSDVLLNMYTTEEAMDIVQDTTEIIDTSNGAKITIPDKEHAKARSEKATSRVADKIPDSKFGNVNQNITDAVEVKEEVKTAPITQTVMQTTVKNESHPPDESPFIASKGSVEFMNGVTVKRDDTGNITNQDEIDKGIPEGGGGLTLAGMEKMETKDLLEIVNADMDMIEAMTVLPGKNTNKKIREIIFAHQNGRLTEYVAELLPKPEVPLIESNASNPPENASAGEIPINKDFDKQAKELFPGELERAKATEGANKYGIPIPDFDKGESRDFATMKSLFNGLVSVNPPVNNPRYLELAGKMGILAAFPDRETFCKNATVKMINELLDTN